MLKRISIVSVAAAFVYVTMLGCSDDPGEPVPSPILIFPHDTATLVPDTLTLTWIDTARGVTTYKVQVSTASNFSALAIDGSTAAPSFAITSPLTNNTTYYWRVNSSNGKRTSAWSSVFSFTTGVKPPEPVNPLNGYIFVSIATPLQWTEAPSAISYHVQMSIDSFSTFIVDSSSVPAGSTSLDLASPLANFTDYFWRISVITAQGQSGWSGSQKFQTEPPKPAAPSLSSPANGATGVSLADTLKWDTTAFVTSYHLQVATDSNFSGIAIDNASLPQTPPAAVISTLSAGTLYYWHVAGAHFYSGQGAWSDTWSFTTQP